MADHGVVVVDREADAEDMIRGRRELHAVLGPAHRPRDLDVALGALLLDGAGLVQQPRDRRGAPVDRLRSFHRADLDFQVVDAEARDRRQDVLHGVDLYVARTENGATPGVRIEVRVLGTYQDFGVPRQV